MNSSNSLEAYYQDNYVPIICFFLKILILSLSKKLIRPEDKDQFLFLQTVLKSYIGVMNYLWWKMTIFSFLSTYLEPKGPISQHLSMKQYALSHCEY